MEPEAVWKRLDSLAQLPTRALKGSLHSVDSYLKKLGQPQNSFTAIHVAGTNGKGSVSTKIATALTLSDYKVGLYTSPHLVSWQERIQIDGQNLSALSWENGLRTIFSLVDEEKIHLSFFECLTLLAFLLFKEAKVDVAVIEVGLGGSFDATNVISPILSIITSIGLDHSQFLGSSLDAIANEKAGILKEGVPVVLGPSCIQEVFFEKSKLCHAPLYPVLNPYSRSLVFDEENCAVARQALELLVSDFPKLCKEKIESGLSVRPPFRYEWRKHPLYGDVLFDVAHNPPGFKKLIEWIKRDHPRKKITVLLGMSKGKEIEQSLQVLTQARVNLIVTGGFHWKAMEAAALALCLRKNGYPHFQVAEGVDLGLSILFQNDGLSEPEVKVIAGSFYLMQPAASILRCDAGLFPGGMELS